MLPSVLYHGSRFKSTELKPSFLVTGKLVEWDGTESNRFLYAGTDKDLAIMMAAAAQAESQGAVEIHTTPTEFVALWDGSRPRSALFHLTIYLYTLNVLPEDNWVKVNNPNNPDVDEYKTQTTFSNKRFMVQIINWDDWCESKGIKVKIGDVKKNPASLRW